MSRCAACGRPLHRPSPSGLCPVCARRLQPTPARPRTIRAAEPAVEHCDGQTALDLEPMQPSLWAL
ncbi:hypothetical protein [Streptomyces lancefieldiae]|uniref:Uncharacterized protein n=1 Tax=Streptomyces lancefieldiae TaxID=3075520 RepID=A0ABU3AIA9_9ACTN|nr:hypothetical protein [Streptomyces sp. DSM 40712]MDT0608803.1 hypothetical protein [Streptomyces sp. DSM 40712]